MTRTTVYDRVRRRDRVCFTCSGRGHEVHHIVPRSLFVKGDTRRDEERNLCLLCRECHDQAHTRVFRGRLLRKMLDRHDYDYSEAPWRKYFGT